jgi:hypothetical protein
VYAYFRIPEPAGRTFAELDLLFERRVPARKFASTDVDVFASAEGERAAEKEVGREMEQDPEEKGGKTEEARENA